MTDLPCPECGYQLTKDYFGGLYCWNCLYKHEPLRFTDNGS